MNMDDGETSLRPIQENDLWLLERQCVDPNTAGELNWPGYASVRRMRQQFDQDGFLGPDGGDLVVMSGNEVAGTVGWRKVTYGISEWQCWNIGGSLLPEFRSRGIGTNAQRLLVRYLFASTSAPRIEAYTDIKNTPEQRALEKIGFVKEGTLRSVQFRQGEWRDLYLYSLLRSDAILGQ